MMLKKDPKEMSISEFFTISEKMNMEHITSVFKLIK